MADGSIAAARMPRTWRIEPLDIARRWASIAVLLITWETVCRLEWVDHFLLPSLSDVLARLASELWRGDLALLTLITAYRAVLSFVIAAVAGVLIGVWMSMSPRARWFWEPVVSFGFPIPKIALMPIFILWFGFFDTSKIAMTAFSAVFPIITATHFGTRNIDRHLIWSARSLGVRDRKLFWRIAIPAALPQILTGLQIAVPICLIVALVTEMLSGGLGLGGYMIAAVRVAQSDKVFAGLICAAAIGSALIYSFALLRRRLLVWHAETSSITP